MRILGDPVLRQTARAVTAFDDGLARLAGDLAETCRLPGRAGLAAPQIGVALRVFVYNIDGDEGCLVNPAVVHTEGRQEGDEGCLSIPGVWMPVVRAEVAVVVGADLDGRPVEVAGTGVLARALQHEADHLDGKLCIDRVDAQTRRRVMASLRNRDLAGS